MCIRDSLFEQAINRQAVRLSGADSIGGLNREAVQTLEGSDFLEAARLLTATPKTK